ncbi:MAG: TPM domain-containing protein [Bacteroidota bacterium]
MGKTATCWCAVLLLLFSAFLYAADVPFLSGRVNDTAGILFPNTIDDLEALLKTHEDSTSNQVAVLTIVSLDGEPIENYSMRVVETWKLGHKGKDNGVLLLVARDDREVRIEVGYGLEGSLPDITCSRIVQNEIIPRFKDGDFDGGVRAGVTSILAAIKGEYTADDAEGTSGDSIGGRIVAFLMFFLVVGLFTAIAVVSTGCQSWFLFVFLIPFWFLFPTAILGFTPGVILFVLYIVGFIVSKFFFAGSEKGKRLQKKWISSGMFASSGRGWSSSGGSSGGGFSGGGGSFGGGGASGKW